MVTHGRSTSLTADQKTSLICLLEWMKVQERLFSVVRHLPTIFSTNNFFFVASNTSEWAKVNYISQGYIVCQMVT